MTLRKRSATRNSDDIPDDTGDGIAAGYVAIGRILGAWGVRGELKIEPLGPAGILSSGRRITVSAREYMIERSLTLGRLVCMKLSGVGNREEARGLRGAYLQVPQGDLEAPGDGEYYRFQLVGLAVRATDGADLGRVTDVLSMAANDVYVVQGPLGEILVPAIDDVIQRVDIAAGEMIIDVVPGLLTER